LTLKFWANDTNGFGYKMLQKMGWTPGKGLGLNEDGQVKHIVAVPKLDSTGIGAQRDYSNSWQTSIKDYKEVLGKLKVLTGTTKFVTTYYHSQPHPTMNRLKHPSPKQLLPAKKVPKKTKAKESPRKGLKGRKRIYQTKSQAKKTRRARGLRRGKEKRQIHPANQTRRGKE
jgi:Pin2-interacting protein X1